MSQVLFARRRGFTFIELIIVIAIFAAVMATTLPFMGSFQQTETLDTQVQDLVQTLRRAQSRAISGRRNTDWGVRLLSGSVVLFAGSGYTSRVQAFDEVHTFEMNYTTSGSGEIVFLRQKGTVQAGGHMTLAHPFGGSGTVLVNRTGQIRAVTSIASNVEQVASSPTPTINWPLDASSGCVAEDTSSTHDGTLEPNCPTSSPDWVAGRISNGLEFNGTTDYVSVPDADALDDTSAFTLDFWVYPTRLNGSPYGVVSKRVSFNNNQSYSAFFYTGNRMFFDIDGLNNRFSTNTVFAEDTWYHVALVFDGSLTSTERAKVYVNGALDVTATESSSSVPNTNSDLYFGILNAGYSFLFEGIIDEVGYFNSALDADQVLSRYERG